MNDEPYRRRLIIAFGLAVAIHEIVAGLAPRFTSEHRNSDEVVASVVRIDRRTPPPTPRPTPRPTPKPTLPPPPPTPVPTVAPHVVRTTPAPVAAAKRAQHRGGAAARKALLLASRGTRTASLVGGSGRGADAGGAGSGAGAGTGTGGSAGTGSGAGGKGNGTGASGDTPCGFVIFVGLRNKYRGGKFYEDVRIEVSLRNGETVSDDLHWPWIYDSEEANPFSDRNLSKKDLEVPMQLPPPGYDLSQQKPATIAAVKHTGPDGFTSLDLCPGQKF